MKNKIHNRIRQYALSHFTKVSTDDFILGEGPFNLKCHINSVQKVKEGKAAKVFMCFCVDKTNDSHCIHFINQLDNGKYQDNTWGWTYYQCDYYIIKEIILDEQEHIWDSLTDIRQAIVKLNSNWLERLIFKIKPDKCI
jgi:hypothetical protein